MTTPWCCEKESPFGWKVEGKPQIVLVDKLHRFGFIECDLCGRSFGSVKLVTRKPTLHVGEQEVGDVE